MSKKITLDISGPQHPTGEYITANCKLFNSVPKLSESDLTHFVAIQGSRYNNPDNKCRLLLVGRALNGWGNFEEFSDEMSFACSAQKRFNKTDRFTTEFNLQIIDENPVSVYDGDKKYHLSSSPFWNYTRDIWVQISGEDNVPDWYENISWTNLYKLSPRKEGNPDWKLMLQTVDACVDILKSEIDALKPTHILFLTGWDWFSCDWAYRRKAPNSRFSKIEAFTNMKCIENPLFVEGTATYAADWGTAKVVVACRPEGRKKDLFTKEVSEYLMV